METTLTVSVPRTRRWTLGCGASRSVQAMGSSHAAPLLGFETEDGRITMRHGGLRHARPGHHHVG